MADLLSIPENVMIQNLLPCLNHNDVLRLRRVCKQTKALADDYLWTPQPGHQGKWELEINSNKKKRTLEAFLQRDLPPPSRIYIANKNDKGPSDQMSFFEDDHLDEFVKRYGKYVTSLAMDKIFYPFTSAKEIGFYESLVNLKKLRCYKMLTIGGSAEFEKKTKNAEGSFLIQPTWSKSLKIFRLDDSDCMDAMWNFINGVSDNLEEIMHPFQMKPIEQIGRNHFVSEKTDLAPVQQLIDRRGGGIQKSQNKLLYDLRYLTKCRPLELLRVFVSCRDNDVMIKKLDASHLVCLICDDNRMYNVFGDMMVRNTGEWTQNSRDNYKRNQFACGVIHSLNNVNETVFPMKLPALEEISIFRATEPDFGDCRRRRRFGNLLWPNLRKMDLKLDYCSEDYIGFLCEQMKQSKLEELSLSYTYRYFVSYRPQAKDFGKFCGDLKKLSISNYFPGSADFFLWMWKSLPLLEDVTLKECPRLTNSSFIGDDTSNPAMLKLEKLKHLAILNLEEMPGINDDAFRIVFRHLKLTSFKLSSDLPLKQITLEGIDELHTGPFAETIVKLDLNKLKLGGVSELELKKVVSRFRSSDMM